MSFCDSILSTVLRILGKTFCVRLHKYFSISLLKNRGGVWLPRAFLCKTILEIESPEKPWSCRYWYMLFLIAKTYFQESIRKRKTRLIWEDTPWNWSDGEKKRVRHTGWWWIRGAIVGETTDCSKSAGAKTNVESMIRLRPVFRWFTNKISKINRTCVIDQRRIWCRV